MAIPILKESVYLRVEILVKNYLINLKRLFMKKDNEKKKLNPQRRGAEFQNIIRDSLVYYESIGKIIPNFWDRPQKHISSNKKLISDFWCFPICSSKICLIEAKVINSRTAFPFSRIEDHQLLNLKNCEKYKAGFGWLIVHFKYGKEDYGVFAVQGYWLWCDIKNNKVSYSLSDLKEWSTYKTRPGFVKLPFKKVMFGDKEVKILELERIF